MGFLVILDFMQDLFYLGYVTTQRELNYKQLGGGGCSFGFGFQEPFNGDAISGLVKKSKSAFFL